MLKIQFKDRRKPAMWLVDSTLKIGSDASCDIVVNEAGVDPVHVELVVFQEDILLKNVSAQRSVFVNDIPVVKEHKLVAWDVIRLESSELEIQDPLKQPPERNESRLDQATVIRPAISPWMLKALSPPLDGQYFSLAHGNIMGREETNDIVLPLSFISRKHTKIAIREDKLYIEDLNSSNGTFVNNEKIKTCELRNGDEIRLDQFTFTVIGPVTKVDSKPRNMVLAKKKKRKNQSPAPKPETTQEPQKIVTDKPVFFHGFSADVQGKVFEITGTENHISRMLGHHLSTSERSVSARHVYLYATELGWEIKNDGASDGLMVNGKMQTKAVLQDGDEIIVGGTQLKFQSVGEQPLNYASHKVESGKKSWLKITGILFALLIAAAAGAYFLDLIPLSELTSFKQK